MDIMEQNVRYLLSSIREVEGELFDRMASASVVNDCVERVTVVGASVDRAVKAALAMYKTAQEPPQGTNSLEEYLDGERKVLQTLRQTYERSSGAQKVRSGCGVEGGRIMRLSELDDVKSVVCPSTYHCFDFINNRLLQTKGSHKSYPDRTLQLVRLIRLAGGSAFMKEVDVKSSMRYIEVSIVQEVWRIMMSDISPQCHLAVKSGDGEDCREVARLKTTVGELADVAYLEVLNRSAIDKVEKQKAECRTLILVLEQLRQQQRRLLHAEAVSQKRKGTLAKVHGTVNAAVSTLTSSAADYRSMVSYINGLESRARSSEKVSKTGCRGTSKRPHDILWRPLMRYQRNLVELHHSIEMAGKKEASIIKSAMKLQCNRRKRMEQVMEAICEMLKKVQVVRAARQMPLERLKGHAFVTFTLHPEGFLQVAQKFIKH